MKNLDTKVIVVDASSGMPMSWDAPSKGFVFVPTLDLKSQRGKGFAVKTYKRCDAILLIKADNENREAVGMELWNFRLMLAEHGKC